MEEGEEFQESIHQYVRANDSTDPEIKSLGEEWKKLCDDMKIDLLYVRSRMDDWFMEVYKSRKTLSDVMEDGTTGRCQTLKDSLYYKFFDDFETIIQQSAILEKIQMTSVKKKIKMNCSLEVLSKMKMSDYCNRIDDWVDLAVLCVQKELELLNKYKYARFQTVQKQEAILKVEQDIKMAERIRTTINDNLKTMKSRVSNIQHLYEQSDEKMEHLEASQAIQTRRHGSIPNPQYFKNQIDRIKGEIDTTKADLRAQQKKISRHFEDICKVLNELVTNLMTRVKEWQREFKFNYADLEATPDDLDKIAPWCSKTGKIIHGILHGSLVNWQNIINSAPNETFESLDRIFQTFREFFQDMLTNFIKSTFVVSEQGTFFVKTGNKRFPKFSVRILAADSFSKHSEETIAHFISEDDLKGCWDGNDLDLRRVEKHEKKLKANKIKFSTENGKDKMECCFQNLQFAQGFKRANKEPNRQVHEEKYRVVFVTKIESVTCWTLSLPLVVTTASNQEAHSLASIMWQCYSSPNIYSPVSDMQEELPWCDVAEMLQKKMARLSTKHRLCQENLNHLKNRLFGREDVSDDMPVSLTQFCWSYMEDTEFSFWKWFLGVYNLIEQYLQQFWNDGLIMGFVHKDRAEKMLEERNVAAGTFILRFSDKHFTNSDGRKSVYGRLTSCVAVLKEIKGLKRNILSHPQDNKRLVIEHVDVADFKKLGGDTKKQDADDGAKNNLANILKETWIKCRDGQNQVRMYKYLYPSGKSREELFDKYCEEGTSVSGYKHTREAYIAILEQAMTRVRQVRLDSSSSQTLSDREIKLESSSSKKPRHGRDFEAKRKRSSRQSSSCQSNLSSQHGSPFHEESSHSHCQSPMSSRMSPVYPGQSPYTLSSPAQSVPSPACTLQTQTFQCFNDMNVPLADDTSRLPIFLKEDSTPTRSLSNNNHRNISENVFLDSDSFQQFDAMEITAENDGITGCTERVTSRLLPQLEESDVTTTTETISTGEEDANLYGNQQETLISFDGVQIIYDDDHILTSQECQDKQIKTDIIDNTDPSHIVLTVKNEDGKLSIIKANSVEHTNENIPTCNRFIDTRLLTPDQIKQVNEWQQTNKEMRIEHTPVTSGDTSICDLPVSTSSGSSGGLNDYSALQLANMGSGDIDPNFAKSIVDQDGIQEDASTM